MSDDQPDFIAAYDQMARAASDVARLMHAYYSACVAAGFSDEAALTLTIAYQTHMLQAGRE